MRTMQLRSTIVALAAPLLLVACGDDPKPKAPAAGEECPTDGTITAQPVPTIREAVAPYIEPGHKVRIAERFSDTATVQLRADQGGLTPIVITLVKTPEGWTTTSVSRC